MRLRMMIEPTSEEFRAWLQDHLSRSIPDGHAKLADAISDDPCSVARLTFDLGRQWQRLQAPSVVLGLVKAVHDSHPPKGKCIGGSKSWRKLSAGLHTVLEVAITTSLPFKLDDFRDIYEQCSGRYWFGESRGEGFYRIAVEHRHISACRSFEHWLGRKPFMWQGKRLACSSAFKWEGHDVTVTSFADDGLSLTACSYLGKDRKPARRFTITHKQLRAAASRIP